MSKTTYFTDGSNAQGAVLAWSRIARRPVLLETICLAVIRFVDTVSTIYLVQSGVAKEGNPLLRWSFQYGDVAFFLTKAMWFLIPLLILESLRAKNDDFVRLALRLGIVGYLCVYVFGTLAIHPHLWR